MLKHLTFKELLKLTIIAMFFLFLNLAFTYIFNSTDKYILIKSQKVFDFIYINKDIGFLLFIISYSVLILLTLFSLQKLKLNYDHLQIKTLINIFFIYGCALSILNFKRNLLLHSLLSDHLVVIVATFISYCYYF